MKIHDITMPLVNGMPVWPGDEAYAFKLNWQQANGDSVNVGHIQMSVHVGTHADSPFHVDRNGVTIESLPLDIFIGPAVVVDVSGTDVITPDHLTNAVARLGHGPLDQLLKSAPRLLLKTLSWRDRSRFPVTFTTLSESAADLIVASGAILLGVDVPSVDERESKSLPIHQTLIGSRRKGMGVQIVESLVLDSITPGVYELFAAPLPIVGGDGAAVRAVLIER